MAQRPTPVIRPAPLADSPPIIPGPRKPVPRFTIQNNGLPHRRLIGIAACALALAFLVAALSALGRSEATSLFPIGIGRLVEAAGDAGWSIAPFLSALENLYAAAGCGFFGALLLFGATPPGAALHGEALLVRRRSDPRIRLPLLLTGLALVVAGLWLGAAGLILFAGLCEAAGLYYLGWAAWGMLIPETRQMLAVIFDPDLAFGNRIEISGGALNRLGRLTIRHDHFLGAATLEPVWPRIVGLAHLRIDYRDQHGAARSLLIEGFAPLAESAAIAAYLNSAFIRAVPRGAFQAPVPPWRMGELIPRA